MSLPSQRIIKILIKMNIKFLVRIFNKEEQAYIDYRHRLTMIV
jgi:hypothetical protein